MSGEYPLLKLTGQSEEAASISFDSDDWYSPRLVIEPARNTMGRIDLDPASSLEANLVVQADRFFDEVINGLLQEWYGCVWLNCPYSEPRLWIEKLLDEFNANKVQQATVIINSNTDQKYYQWLSDYIFCLPDRRIPFYRPATEGRKDGNRYCSTIFYLGGNQRSFYQEFRPLGQVVIPAQVSKLKNISRVA